MHTERFGRSGEVARVFLFAKPKTFGCTAQMMAGVVTGAYDVA
jgi:hypothetical protein